MKTRAGIAAAAVLASAVLVLAGCATAPATPAPSPVPTDAPQTTDPQPDDIDAAWLDNGRMIAVITWGSSSVDCTPQAADVTADGQNVTVTMAEPEGTVPCTADFTARATPVALPAGVDPTKEITVTVAMGDQKFDTDLDGAKGVTGVPGEPTDYLPSAGWFDDNGLVLLTWGSGNCRPIVKDIAETADTLTVTFTPNEGACTRDMVPRTTVLQATNDDITTLTLVGDNLDGTVTILGD